MQNYFKSLKNSTKGEEKFSFFPRPPVDFGLHYVKLPLFNLAEISAFWEILPEKLVGIFDSAFLPGAERVGKVHRGTYASGQPLVVHEHAAVVSGYYYQVHLPVAEAGSVGLNRALVYGYAVGNERAPR